jgi:hypothetical protein
MCSTAASVRTVKSVTVGTAPTFRSAERAAKRKEVFFFYIMIMYNVLHNTFSQLIDLY